VPLTKQNRELPFDVEVCDIAENPRKGEPAHHHFDLRYLFTIKDGAAVRSDNDEVTSYKWLPFADFAVLPHFTRLAEKVETLLTDA
jgi:hypothetical protein